MELSPASMSQADRYRIMIGSIVPRPIALVSTRSASGADNLAPFSFFSGVGSDPMMVLFCPANKPDGTDKDSLLNARPVVEGGTGEFVINVVPERLAAQAALAAEPLSHGDSEFDLTGLTPAPSTMVKPPRVAESPVSLECVTRQVIRTNPGRAGGGNIVLGEVVRVHVDDAIINERLHIDPALLDAVGRMGGLSYCRTHDRFDLKMGR